MAAGIATVAWPAITLYVVSIMVAWYLIVFGTIHIVSALAGPKLSWWWTGLLLGISELVLGVWAARSWETLAGNAGDPGRSVGHQPRRDRDLRRLHAAPGRQAGRPAGRMTAGRAASSASARRDAAPAEAALFKRLAPARAGHAAKEQK